jgi:hypothetical protein
VASGCGGRRGIFFGCQGGKRTPAMGMAALMTHKYRGCIVVLSINKSVEPNEEQKVLTSGFD